MMREANSRKMESAVALRQVLSKLACQPLPGAGMNTRPREGLDDLVVGITPRFGEATSSRTQHRKSKKKISVTAYVDNNCSGSLPALDRNCL